MSREKTELPAIHGILLILLAILCLSILAPLIRIGLTAAVDPVPLLAIRLIIATMVLGAVFGLTRPGVFRIDRRGLLACLLVGGSDTIASICYYNAFTHVSTSVAHVIFSSYPVLALVLLSFRGERFSPLQFVGLTFALTGVFLLIGPGGDVNLVGTLLALGAALGYATTLALTQWLLRGYDSRTIAIYVIGIMAILTTGFWALQWEGVPRITPTGWTVILVTAIVSTALARLLLFAGIRRAGSGTVALLAPVETLLAVTWAVVFLGDRLSSVQWVGGALIVTSMNLVMRRRPGPRSSLKQLMGRWKSIFAEWV